MFLYRLANSIKIYNKINVTYNKTYKIYKSFIHK